MVNGQHWNAHGFGNENGMEMHADGGPSIGWIMHCILTEVLLDNVRQRRSELIEKSALIFAILCCQCKNFRTHIEASGWTRLRSGGRIQIFSRRSLQKQLVS